MKQPPSKNTSRQFRIMFRKDQWIQVYIWRTQKEYKKQLAELQYGKCATYIHYGNRNKKHSEFGIMHFSHKYLGAGCFAHELQHFMFDWISTHLKEVNPRNEEKLAQLADDITRLFWNNYYK